MAMERLHWVLVHGAWQGAWMYYKTMALLQQEGYKVTAVDLASCGTSTVDPNTVTDFKTYNQPLVDVLNAIPDTEQVVLVAQSMGGFSMTHAMEQFSHKIVLAIAVAAILLLNGASIDDSPTFSDMLFKDTPISKEMIPNFGNGPKNPPTTFSIDKEDLPKRFYHAVLPENVVLAQILCRPVPAPVLMGTVVNYTPEKHGTVPSVYIKCLQDRALLPAAQDYIIEETPQEEVIEMDTDHTPMLSAPKELHQILMQLAKKYAHGGV
jgi:pimeloyl-ACP methyl ester carboxylesterase